MLPDETKLDDLKENTAKEIFESKFPHDSIFMTRPKDCSDLHWINHKNSLMGMICEIKQFFEPNTTYTQLMRELRPKKFANYAPINKFDGETSSE